MLTESQVWLQTRLDGLLPGDLSGATAFYTACPLLPPEGFQDHWQRIREHHNGDAHSVMSADESQFLYSAQLVLVFADVNDSSQLLKVKSLGKFLESVFQPERKPAIIFVQHSGAPQTRVQTSETMQSLAFADIMRHGICDIIEEQKASFKLVWAVQNRLFRHRELTSELNDCAEWKRELLQRKRNVNSSMDHIFWTYFREKGNTQLPPIDPTIAPGLPKEIDGRCIGACVGQGAYGAVHTLIQDGEFSGEVVKVVAKDRVSGLNDIKRLRRQLRVMILMSSTYPHPNIIKLQNIFHSQSHVFLQMEDGGSRNLFSRLRHRDRKRSPLNCLSLQKAESMVMQLMSAMSHMHTTATTAHRDIKPENIVISETYEDIHIKVVDFDTAIVDPRTTCFEIVGTFPFMAPEIMLEEAYNPFAADVWSMAVVILEISCGVNVLQKSLGLHACHFDDHQMQKRMTAKIHQYFLHDGSTLQLLNDELHPDLYEMSHKLAMVLPGLFDVESSSRSSCEQALSAFSLARF